MSVELLLLLLLEKCLVFCRPREKIKVSLLTPTTKQEALTPCSRPPSKSKALLGLRVSRFIHVFSKATTNRSRHV